MTEHVDTSAFAVNEWPREIFAAERGEFDHSGCHVYSEHATVPRYEGDEERDREFHRYVDGDILDSQQRYYEEMLTQARAERDTLAAEVEQLRLENKLLASLNTSEDAIEQRGYNRAIDEAAEECRRTAMAVNLRGEGAQYDVYTARPAEPVEGMSHEGMGYAALILALKPKGDSQ